MTLPIARPLVSVGVPVFNAQRHLTAALDALMTQTYDNLEIIISDNNSSDDTAELCRHYAELDSRIKYIRQDENIGILANFQFVLNEADGKYFMWFAGDDECESSYIEELVGFMEQNVEYVTAGTDVKVVDDAGKLLRIEELSSVRKCRCHSEWPSVQKEFFRFYIDNRYLLIYGIHRTTYIKKCSLNFQGRLKYLTSLEIPFLAQMSSFGKMASICRTLKIYRSHERSSHQMEVEKSNSLFYISRYINVWSCLLRIVAAFPFSSTERLRILLYLLFSFPLYLARGVKQYAVRIVRAVLRPSAELPENEKT